MRARDGIAGSHGDSPTGEAAGGVKLDREIGSLEPGKQADLIIVETRVPHLTPLHQPVSAIVYAAKGSDVRTVMGGTVVGEGPQDMGR